MRKNKLTKQEIRQKVWKKAGGNCAHCGNRVYGTKTVDHVIPKSIGGTNCIQNLMPTCVRCNGSRGSRWVNIRKYYKYASEEAIWECEMYAGKFYSSRRRMM